MCISGGYFVNLANNRSSLVNSNHFLLSKDIFSSSKCENISLTAEIWEKLEQLEMIFLKMEHEITLIAIILLSTWTAVQLFIMKLVNFKWTELRAAVELNAQLTHLLFVWLYDCDHSSLSRWNRWTQDTRRQAGSGWQKGHGPGGGLQNRSVSLSLTYRNRTIFLYLLLKDTLWFSCTTPQSQQRKSPSCWLLMFWNSTDL